MSYPCTIINDRDLPGKILEVTATVDTSGKLPVIHQTMEIMSRQMAHEILQRSEFFTSRPVAGLPYTTLDVSVHVMTKAQLRTFAAEMYRKGQESFR